MANILNYLKGNYLISQNAVFCSIESQEKNEISLIAYDLFCFSILHNINLEDRTKIILDFDVNFKYNLLEKLKAKETKKFENVEFNKINNDTIYLQISNSFYKNENKNSFVLEKNGVNILNIFFEKIDKGKLFYFMNRNKYKKTMFTVYKGN